MSSGLIAAIGYYLFFRERATSRQNVRVVDTFTIVFANKTFTTTRANRFYTQHVDTLSRYSAAATKSGHFFELWDQTDAPVERTQQATTKLQVEAACA